jgi:hypothetical protein
VCGSKGDSTQPAQFTSTFIVTSLESFELILGVGWLEQHHAQIGFRERSIQLRVDGAGEQQCIRPLARCNRDGSTAAEAAPVKLLSITQRALCKAMRRKEVEELFVVLVRPQADADAAEKQAQPAAAATPTVPGSEDPLIKPLLDEFSSVFQVPKPGIPPKRGVEHSIKLMSGTVPPAARPLRHQSARDSAFLQEYVAEGVKAGTIQLSTSPYGSMALIVLKKDGTPRVVIDYRTSTHCRSWMSCSTAHRARSSSLLSICVMDFIRLLSRRRTERKQHSARASGTTSIQCCPWGCAMRQAPSCS